jgi:tetratricopeptide (TPR) repeat protein
MSAREGSGPQTVRRRLVLYPADSAALNLLGHSARAASISPKAQFFYDLGNALLAAGSPAEACRAFRRAIAFLPGDLAILANAAEAAARDNRVEQAVPLHQRALAAKRHATLVLSNLAQAWTRLGRMDRARQAARQAIGLDPALAAAHVNVGLALQGADDRADVEPHYRRALAAEPKNAEAEFALATCRLAEGDLATGFRLYESRFRLREMRSAVGHWRLPAWDGKVKPGLRLMIWCEQGFGDSIHFIRYATIPARAGARVTVACPEPLRRLFEGLAPTIRTCPLDAAPEVDAQASLMSLPHLLGIAGNSMPAEVPYLHPISPAPPQVLATARPRIGLAWAGRPEYHGDRLRSMTLETFRTLAATLSQEDVRLFSLQVGPRRDDLRGVTTIVDLGGEFRDFADTAAAIAALDLVIAVDSSVTHLAGALGCPTWVMLQRVAEWRWLKGRTDSPWYPTMRLFRQARLGDWPSLIMEVVQSLRAWRETWQ